MSLFIGHDIINLRTVDSTNSYAINLLKDKGVAEGVVVRADIQTEGRGQRGNTWSSETAMNLTFSVILFPHFLPVPDQFYLNRAIACAVADFLSEILNFEGSNNSVNQPSSFNIQIKWPNDILVNGKKIGGILIENSIRGEEFSSSVAGIGLNINQENFEGLENAVSLKNLSDQNFDINELLIRLCSFIEARYLQLKFFKYEKLEKDFLSRLYCLDEWHQYTTDKKFKGKIKNVSREGKLLVETEGGGVKEFGFKEISFLI